MKIGFIGAGQMAQALAAGIAKSQDLGSTGPEFWISDPSPDATRAFLSATENVATTTVVDTNSEVVLNVPIVFLAVKPHFLAKALEHLKTAVEQRPDVVLISIVAGATIFELRRLTGADRIVRTMPNTPCLIGCGAIGYSASPEVGASELATAVSLLACVGRVFQVDEANLDAVTGLSGSGPAYVFTFIEALTDGGVLNGLSRAKASELALQTVLGSAQLLRQTGEHPAALRDRVTSPGGTTIAALKALEETGFRDAVMSAVSAATERSIELGS